MSHQIQNTPFRERHPKPQCNRVHGETFSVNGRKNLPQAGPGAERAKLVDPRNVETDRRGRLLDPHGFHRSTSLSLS